MPELPLNQVLLGNCLEVMKTLPDNSLDCIVSDPPYGLGTKQPTREDIIKYLQGGALDTGGDFMGKDWEIPPVSVWEQCFRVLKPGGHLLAFAGTRTFDMMSVGIRAAGFEDRDTVASMFGPSVLQWVYGAGFPKSLDIAKAIDKMLNVKGKVIRTEERYNEPSGIVNADRGATSREFVTREICEPASDEAKKWAGWGTALKPAWEPILCFRKPTSGKTAIRNILENGVGGLNIGECRVGAEPRVNPPAGNVPGGNSLQMSVHGMPQDAEPTVTVGRWPANVVLSHTAECKLLGAKTIKSGSLATSGGNPDGHGIYSGRFPRGDGRTVGYAVDGEEGVEDWECTPNCPVKIMDDQTGTLTSGGGDRDPNGRPGLRGNHLEPRHFEHEGDSGGPSRFFTGIEPESSFYYTAKASRSDRNEGLDAAQKGGFQEGAAYLSLRDDLSEEDAAFVLAEFTKPPSTYQEIPDHLTDRDVPGHLRKYFKQGRKGDRGNIHVTVKPVALMRWLIRLVCPKGGVVLDPYSGSGTTLVAASEEGMDFIGIELDPAYHKIASTRAVARAGARDTKKTESSIFEEAMGGGGD